MKFLSLHHELSDETPGFAGRPCIQIELSKCLSKQDSCNQLFVHMSNHVGTHIDFPSHFIAGGKTLSDYSQEDLWFSKFQVMDLKVGEGELISAGKWLECIEDNIELLLVRTGFERLRSQESYWKNGPGVHHEVGLWLKKKRPSVRCIGFDFISLTSLHHRKEGKLAHQTFLDGDKPITIIEDMKLSGWEFQPLEGIMVVPLPLKNSDGAQVSVLGVRKGI